ncbi:glycosyltransferase family 2 protein [Pseudomonas yamanorum]|jgi:glycosyltransferase involved in cell wall biosynthesis|uniref:glycosyltransferase family 2 protein n=1 Tax=Pseudomonas yamanorum TaxID=515393 RepID=UPI0007A48BF8|nr:glycosyltransferase family 2 protein [Pseudomonas yamanorum]
MMPQSLCSIIVPMYNVENYIERCLASLVAQTYEPIEIIIVDDSSTDNSLNVCERYFDGVDNVRILTQVNSGQGVARNFGVSVASGEYIVFVDADDWIDENLCSDMIRRIDEDQLDFISYGLDFIDQNNQIVHKIDSFKYSELSGEAIFVAAMLDDSVLSSPVNKLYRRSFINVHGIEFPPVRACEDMYFSRAISFFSSTTAFVSKVYYHALVRDGSTSRAVGEVFFASLIKTLELEKQFLMKNGVWEKYGTLFSAHASKQVAHALVLAAFRVPAYVDYSRIVVELRGLPVIKSARRSEIYALLGQKHKVVLALGRSTLLLRAVAKVVKFCGYSPY